MNHQKLINFAPIPLRIIAGFGFMIHGLQKLLDIPNTQNAFINMGLTSELAIFVGLLEFIGGLIILFGSFDKNCFNFVSNKYDRCLIKLPLNIYK